MVTGWILWSPNHEIMFGLAPGSFEGSYRAFAQRVFPADLPLVDRGLAEAIAARQPYTGEFRVLWPDQSVHWIMAQGQFTFDDQGRPLRMLGVVSETTGRKESEAALHALSAHVLHVQDQERRRLSRELHDSTAQHLAALSISLSNLKRAAAQSCSQLTGLCEEALQLANQAAQEIRTQSYLLHPPLLEALGLPGALEDYTRGFAARSGIQVQLGDLNAIGRLSDEQELALFRVVQESLSNVLRHSGSKTAALKCACADGWLTLEISDSGCGISPAELARFNRTSAGLGVGLGGMGERLRHLGGRLELESSPTGTTVRAVVPCTCSP
jgi:signal transduction histidine kinase